MATIDKIRIYLLEDEIITREALRECLENLDYDVCGFSDNAQEALKDIQTLKPDIALLDINVKGDYDGVWLGDKLNIPFIYLTAYTDANTLQKTKQTAPAAFLIKPFEIEQVKATISVALNVSDNTDNNNGSTQDYHFNNEELFIKIEDDYLKLLINDIVFIHNKMNTFYIHTVQNKYAIHDPEHTFVDNLNKSKFIKIHDVYVINKTFIKNYSAGFITIDSHELPLDISYKQSFFEAMQSPV